MQLGFKYSNAGPKIKHVVPMYRWSLLLELSGYNSIWYQLFNKAEQTVMAEILIPGSTQGWSQLGTLSHQLIFYFFPFNRLMGSCGDMDWVRYHTTSSYQNKSGEMSATEVEFYFKLCVCVCVYLHWRFLVTRVHKAQGVSDHTHFNLFVDWTGNVLENSWRYLQHKYSWIHHK